MRVVALDIGEKRVGVAMSDAGATIASPLAVFDAGQVAKGDAIRALVAEHEVDLVVVGLPLTLAGEEGGQARRVREVADGLARGLPVPVVYFDERLSSAEAVRSMRAAGTSVRRGRGEVDKVAAALFLQAFLDSGGAMKYQERERGHSDD